MSYIILKPSSPLWGEITSALVREKPRREKSLYEVTQAEIENCNRRRQAEYDNRGWLSKLFGNAKPPIPFTAIGQCYDWHGPYARLFSVTEIVHQQEKVKTLNGLEEQLNAGKEFFLDTSVVPLLGL